MTTNGSLSVSNNLLVGDHGRGLMTVTGAASVWVGSDLSVGNSSAASETNGSTLTIGGGSVFVGDELRLGGPTLVFGSHSFVDDRAQGDNARDRCIGIVTDGHARR